MLLRQPGLPLEKFRVFEILLKHIWKRKIVIATERTNPGLVIHLEGHDVGKKKPNVRKTCNNCFANHRKDTCRIILHIICVQFLGLFESYSLLLRVITLTLRKKNESNEKKPKKTKTIYEVFYGNKNKYINILKKSIIIIDKLTKDHVIFNTTISCPTLNKIPTI